MSWCFLRVLLVTLAPAPSAGAAAAVSMASAVVHLLCMCLAMQRIVHSDKEWQALLTPGQYKILRQAGTELPNTRYSRAV